MLPSLKNMQNRDGRELLIIPKKNNFRVLNLYLETLFTTNGRVMMAELKGVVKTGNAPHNSLDILRFMILTELK